MTHRVPSSAKIALWNADIQSNGVKRINARALLRAFGAQRRGQVAVGRIQDWLRAQSPSIYANGLERARTLDDPVQLAHEEIRQIGRLASTEKFVTERFVHELMPQLGLQDPEHDFRPVGSRDALDFLCRDRRQRSVVVEIKKEDGERRVVEQVLRYIRLVREDPRAKDPRGLIITGLADLHTRRALEELEPQYHIDWFVYGIQDDDRIVVEPVPIQALQKRP